MRKNCMDERAAKRFCTGRSPEIPTRIWERRINKVKFRHFGVHRSVTPTTTTACTHQNIRKRTQTTFLRNRCRLLNEGHHNPGPPHPPVALTTNFDLSSVAATTDLAAADDHKSGSDKWLHQPPFSAHHRFHSFGLTIHLPPINFFGLSLNCHWLTPLAPPQTATG